MSDHDAIVIGAGYGGVTVASLLAREGRRVLLVDKNEQAGGKAMTVRRRGYAYELWPVHGLPARDSRLHELVRTLGVGDDSLFLMPDGPKVGERFYKRPDGTWQHDPPIDDTTGGTPTIERTQQQLDVSDEEMAKFVEMATAIATMPEEEIDALDDVGMLEWMRGFDLAEPIITQQATMLNLVFVAPVDRIPVSEGVRTLRQLFLGGGPRYAAGGFGRVAELAARYVDDHGGRFLTGTRVETILVEGGRAVGIRTKDGEERRAPVVISNAGIHPTALEARPRGALPADYVERVRGLEPGWGMVGLRYFFSRPVFEARTASMYSDQSWLDTDRYARLMASEWEPDVPLAYITIPSNWDPSMAPPGHQVVQVGILGSPDPTSEVNERLVDRAEATIEELWPGVLEHLERKERYTARQVSNLTRDSAVPGQGGECIGLGQVIGQCGGSKPDARTPLPGLYLVGCDAGGFGCGTHQAVESGFAVAAMVRAELEARQPA
ncbi:MAG: NAD(P)/FAD-dependent oxidoreductase [Acidimicrobiia bacterium]|nr:NAD(P)/FAD-dependent oxidoreductase [Acidimicrobiia bacterium]